jgi:hypothetical protein
MVCHEFRHAGRGISGEVCLALRGSPQGVIRDVIEPTSPRSIVAMVLRTTLANRQTRAPKKHGNMVLSGVRPISQSSICLVPDP